jgi:2-(1,2-epoxy-1,2-dihydrophenyl)acetyl-CoA isomerase
MAEVETSSDGGVMTITLNRPDVLNAFNRAMHEQLGEALKDARDPSVRAVVLTGAGRAFSVGQDLKEFQEGEDVVARLRGLYDRNVLALRVLEKPVLAAVNGPVAGGALGFALACDLRIAADSASFAPAFISIGIVPDCGTTYFAVQLLGYARAFEWLCTGRKLTAAEAHAWGLVHEVVEADRVADRVTELASTLATMPTRGIGMTKRLLDRAAHATLEEQLALEAQLQRAATESADFKEGVAAFLEKRDPRFTGQ